MQVKQFVCNYSTTLFYCNNIVSTCLVHQLQVLRSLVDEITRKYMGIHDNSHFQNLFFFVAYPLSLIRQFLGHVKSTYFHLFKFLFRMFLFSLSAVFISNHRLLFICTSLSLSPYKIYHQLQRSIVGYQIS